VWHQRYRRRVLGVAIVIGAGAAWLAKVCADPDGRLAVWTDTRGGGELWIRIDGGAQPVGALAAYFAGGTPACARSSAVLIVTAAVGRHRLEAADDAGRHWRGEIDVERGACTLVRLAPAGTPRRRHTIPADSG
jgi:hypothetical protein